MRFLEYKTDEEVYAIDTSISAEITINDDELQIVPEFMFEEKTRFYILLEREVVVSLEGDLCNLFASVISHENDFGLCINDFDKCKLFTIQAADLGMNQ